MINGLAIWHYPHRSLLENIVFFAEQGFSCVSVLGSKMTMACQDCELSGKIASVIKEKQLVLTVHYKLPESHSVEDVKDFKTSVDIMANWQRNYGKLISVLSFDVPQGIRDNIMPYIQYVLDCHDFDRVAVEDFGLTEEEKLQIEPLKNNKRFGFLVDIGHMYIRMRGKNKEGKTLFENSPEECEKKEKPIYNDFIKAFKSKEFPIFEIHLHNNNGVDDLHYFFDEGTLDMQIIANVLKDLKYDEILTIESAPGFKFECRFPESDERIIKTFEYWKSLLR